MTQREPGRVGRAFARMFLREAIVRERIRPSERFFSIVLEGDALCDVAWTPGQKIQILLGPGLTTRTFTPTEWDAATGRTRILAYAHGDGPGSDWASSVAAGTPCHIFGPRPSLDVTRMPAGSVLFGDEASIGLAIALTAHHPDNPPRCILEVNAAAEAVPVLAQFGLHGATVVERDPAGLHLPSIARAIEGAGQHDTIILTGKATSIQAIRAHLKSAGRPGTPVVTKAYWAPGKRGLD